MDGAEALSAEIEQTREAMGDTAAALVGKLDVPSRARSAGADKKDRMTGIGPATNGTGPETPRDRRAQARQESTETRARLAEAAAEAAERAGTAIGTLPGRASGAVSLLRERTGSVLSPGPDRTARKQRRFALAGAGLAATAVVAVLIRRLR